MNSVILIGRLARDPELSYTPNTQTALCRLTVAVDRGKRNGEDLGADFIDVTVWDRQAENCDRYLSKGSQVAVRGRIETGSYTNREGQKVYTTRVVADRFGGVEFLSSKSSNGGQSSYQGGQSSYQGGQNSYQGGSQRQFDGGRDQNYNDTRDSAFSAPQEPFGGFDDMPDSFQAAEDDIPF
jgi:single-strand DNA-binding protein